MNPNTRSNIRGQWCHLSPSGTQCKAELINTLQSEIIDLSLKTWYIFENKCWKYTKTKTNIVLNYEFMYSGDVDPKVFFAICSVLCSPNGLNTEFCIWNMSQAVKSTCICPPQGVANLPIAADWKGHHSWTTNRGSASENRWIHHTCISKDSLVSCSMSQLTWGGGQKWSSSL